MNKFFVILLLICYNIGIGQTSSYHNVSKSFDFKVKIHRGMLMEDPCIVTVLLQSKISKKAIQTIKYKAGFLSEDVFTDPNFVRSYSTGKNRKVEVSDYDFGDLVISDLNFDGRDDFAIKNDSGGNEGPFYNFYIQNKNGSFFIDKFLTDSVGSFPKHIIKETKTITTLIHANAHEECKTSYQFNTKKSKWKTIKRTFVKY